MEIAWLDVIVVLSLALLANGEISDKRLCADPKCQAVLSLARTLINYQSVEDGVLSFPINKEVRIYSKSAGSNPSLWGVEIQGKRGYVNKEWLREYRVLKKPSQIHYEIATELEYLREMKFTQSHENLKTVQLNSDAASTKPQKSIPDLSSSIKLFDHGIIPVKKKVIYKSKLEPSVKAYQSNGLELRGKYFGESTFEFYEEKQIIAEQETPANEDIVASNTIKNSIRNTCFDCIFQNSNKMHMHESQNALKKNEETTSLSKNTSSSRLNNKKNEPIHIGTCHRNQSCVSGYDIVENFALNPKNNFKTVNKNFVNAKKVTTLWRDIFMDHIIHTNHDARVPESPVTIQEMINYEPPCSTFEVKLALKDEKVPAKTETFNEQKLASETHFEKRSNNYILFLKFTGFLSSDAWEENICLNSKDVMNKFNGKTKQCKLRKHISEREQHSCIHSRSKCPEIQVGVLQDVELATSASYKNKKPDLINFKHNEEIAVNKEGLDITITGIMKNLTTTFTTSKTNEYYSNAKKISHGVKYSQVHLRALHSSGENLSPNNDENTPIHICSEQDAHTNKWSSCNLLAISRDINQGTGFIIFLALTAFFGFTMGFFFFCKRRREKFILSKVNLVERNLLQSYIEEAFLQRELTTTLNKLGNIENNTFGSNDMIIALRKELEAKEIENGELKKQIAGLEKELENAAEAGLELNKIVSELLNNQIGNDIIVNSVEDLQKQLNEQQKTIFEINSTLAEKSCENSELQMLLSELNVKYQEQICAMRDEYDNIAKQNNLLQLLGRETKSKFEQDMSNAMTRKNEEIDGLKKQLSTQASELNELQNKYQYSEARMETLEETLMNVAKSHNTEAKDLFRTVDAQANILATEKERNFLKERLESEVEAHKLLQDQFKIISEELLFLKEEQTKSETEKFEALTRLDVLSKYFKEKEANLEKTINLKESMWMKQQGEKTSIVERISLMQKEIQGLRSQNESLRAEIEAQVAAHKLQTTSLENRAHESWLAARTADRKLEDARNEATTLRRKIGTLLGGLTCNLRKANDENVDTLQDVPDYDRNKIASSTRTEPSVSPLINAMPSSFLAPPFIGPPLPFIGIPTPLMPPGEIRPPPLGRIVSPPPPRNGSTRLYDNRYLPEDGVYLTNDNFISNARNFSTKDTETDGSQSCRSRSGDSDGYSSQENENCRGIQKNSQKTLSFHSKSGERNTVKNNYFLNSENESASDW